MFHFYKNEYFLLYRKRERNRTEKNELGMKHSHEWIAALEILISAISMFMGDDYYNSYCQDICDDLLHYCGDANIRLNLDRLARNIDSRGVRAVYNMCKRVQTYCASPKPVTPELVYQFASILDDNASCDDI
jgi:hypothetical protein